MYGAYYPYLYGRGAARSFHHAPHFQYDRLNVQGGHNVGGAEAAYGAGAAAASPPLLQHRRAKEEDLSAHSRTSADGGGGSSESEGEGGAAGAAAGARAQYVSANCVVFTHYAGDVAAVVDQHFARALAQDKHKESVPMASRNLPASFFNAAAAPPCAGVDLYEYDPWHQHYAGYGGVAHARHAAEYHAAHHNMAAAGYGGLLLPRQLHAQYKPVDWQHPHLEPAPPYSYPTMPGLEAQVQDTSKDLYWF